MNKSRSTTKVTDRDPVRVGATLARFRHLRGMTQDELSTQMEIARTTLARIEIGSLALTDRNLAKAAEALGVRQIEIMRPRAEEDDAA